MSGTGWGTLLEVHDGMGDPLGGSGWVGEPSWRFRRGWETLEVVRDGSVDPGKGPGQVG